LANDDAGDGHPPVGHHSPLTLADSYAERLIGSIRRECLDRVIAWNERGLRPILIGHIAHD
jgi:hypothetical protein